MNNLEQKTRDWLKLKVLGLRARTKQGEERKKILDDLYHGIKDYFEKYDDKFDYTRRPKE
jgi:hypothetical protein